MTPGIIKVPLKHAALLQRCVPGQDEVYLCKGEQAQEGRGQRGVKQRDRRVRHSRRLSETQQKDDASQIKDTKPYQHFLRIKLYTIIYQLPVRQSVHYIGCRVY